MMMMLETEKGEVCMEEVTRKMCVLNNVSAYLRSR